ncbi:hypothetical protein L7F22_059529 [Adiantum nelumboides]|nr:hypothetical protein [Adiantum nelumboides]
MEDDKRIPFTVLDALSATGLRALRYAKEIPFATNVIANDLSRSAVEAIEMNIDHNQVKGKVHSNVGDARAYMYSKMGTSTNTARAHMYIALTSSISTPYGTAAPFIDAALQSLVDGGLLAVTCTDAGVFASTGYLEKTHALYGGLPIKGAHSHEAGLRLIINSIAQTGAKYGLSDRTTPLTVHRLLRPPLHRVHKSAAEVKLLAGTTMLTYTCDQGVRRLGNATIRAQHFVHRQRRQGLFKHGFSQAPTTDRQCEHCGFRMHLGGPMWAGPLHNRISCSGCSTASHRLDPKVYGTTERLRGMLTTALEEDLTLAATNIPADAVAPEPTSSSSSSPTITTAAVAPAEADSTTPQPGPFGSAAIIPRLPPATLDAAPFFFIPNYLAKVVHAQTPSEDLLRGAIRHAGYRVTRSHCKAGSFKTDAPWPVLWEIMREWMLKFIADETHHARVATGFAAEHEADGAGLGGVFHGVGGASGLPLLPTLEACPLNFGQLAGVFAVLRFGDGTEVDWTDYPPGS